MRAALRQFHNRVSSIEGTVDLRDSLVRIGSQTSESLDPAAEALRQLIRQIGQAGMQPSLDGSVLVLTAAFEQFIADVMIRYVEDLPTIIPAYADLPYAIRLSNERQTGVAITRDGIFSDRFTDFELRQFVTNLKGCQDGVTLYVLNGEAIVLNDRNLRPGILQNLFSRLGIANIWTIVDPAPLLIIWPHLSGQEAVASRARNELNEIIETRNQIAHRAGSTTIGPDSLRSYISFQRRLAEALVEGLENHTRSS